MTSVYKIWIMYVGNEMKQIRIGFEWDFFMMFRFVDQLVFLFVMCHFQNIFQNNRYRHSFDKVKGFK